MLHHFLFAPVHPLLAAAEPFPYWVLIPVAVALMFFSILLQHIAVKNKFT